MDPRTHVPFYAWGDGLVISGFSKVNMLNAQAAARSFVNQYSSLFGVSTNQLTVASEELVAGKVHVRFQQVHEGYKVLNSRLDVKMTGDGKVYMFRGRVFPGIEVENKVEILVEDAWRFAEISPEQTRRGCSYIEKGTHVLPIIRERDITYRLVHNVVVVIDDQHQWDTYIDVEDGNVLWRRNLVIQGDEGDPDRVERSAVRGRVQSRVAAVSSLYGDTIMPVSDSYVELKGSLAVTDASGEYEISGDSLSIDTVTVRFAGPYAWVRRADTVAGTQNGLLRKAIQASEPIAILWDDGASAGAERSVFFHLNRVHEYYRQLDGSSRLVDLDSQMVAICNHWIMCNAGWSHYNQRLSFGVAGMGCANAGEIADVIYHEYCHAVQHYLYRAATGAVIVNGALGEAMADIAANMVRDDPRIGIGFLLNAANDGIIRNSDNNKKYPDDITGEVHDDGEILSGAVWELRKMIGIDIARRLTYNTMCGVPDGTSTGDAFLSYLLEMLSADDDDGDMSNGTPHSSLILSAFMKHGIPLNNIVAMHDPIQDQSSGNHDYPLHCVAKYGSSIFDALLEIQEVRAYYTVDEWGSCHALVLTRDAATREYRGCIPTQRDGTLVRYYIEAKGSSGDVKRLPSGDDDYHFVVGMHALLVDHFDDEAGWKTYSTATGGDWIRATPVGTYDLWLQVPPPAAPWLQPDRDHTNTGGLGMCWVTGNAPTEMGMDANDVDDGEVTLVTPSLKLSAMRDPVLRYARWYCNYSIYGRTPLGKFTVRVSSDGGSTWCQLDESAESQLSWSLRSHRLRKYVALTDSICLSFVASDTLPGSIVEAAIDDFEILDYNPVNAMNSDADVRSLRLYANPNPFTITANIMYEIPSGGIVRMRICSMLGRHVSTLVDDYKQAGVYTVRCDMRELPRGVYMCVLEASGQSVYQLLSLTR